MTNTRVELTQPGDEVDMFDDFRFPKELETALAESKCVALLWSPWGVEGVYTNAPNLEMGIKRLRYLAAYQSAMITVELKMVDVIV